MARVRERERDLANAMKTARTLSFLQAVLLAFGLFGCESHDNSRSSHSPGDVTGPGSLQSGQADYAFVDVTVIPMNKDGAFPGFTVLVQGDRIVSVAGKNEIQVPPTTTIIDGRGLFLLPGLADMHTHPNVDSDLPLYPIHGVTTIRINGDFGKNLEWKAATDQGALFYPNLFAAGPILDIDPPWWPGSDIVSTPQEAHEAVKRQAREGHEFIKIMPRFDAETYRALIDAAHEYDLLVTGHALKNVALRDVLAMGIDAIEHMDGYVYAVQDPPLGPLDNWPDRPHIMSTQQRYWMTASDEEFQVLAADLRQYGTWTVPTLTVELAVQKTQSEVDHFLSSDLAEIMHPEYLDDWSTVVVDATTSKEAAKAHRVRLRFLKALHDSGANILAGTDSANPFVVHGFALHDELGYFVQAGLTPFEALATSTVEAARFLQQEDEFGHIAPGLRADLLLLEENPLEDISNTRNIAGVMLRGEWMPSERLAEKLEEIKAELAGLSLQN